MKKHFGYQKVIDLLPNDKFAESSLPNIAKLTFARANPTLRGCACALVVVGERVRLANLH